MSLETSIVLRVKGFQESYFRASEKNKLFFLKTLLSITPLAFSLKKHPSFPVSFSNGICQLCLQWRQFWFVCYFCSNFEEIYCLENTRNELGSERTFVTLHYSKWKYALLPVSNKYKTMLLRRHLDKYIRKVNYI